ncbi:iron ABC transporter permease, partial [Halobium palmae]
MSNESAETGSALDRVTGRFTWFDGRLFTLMVGSVAVVGVAGLVQVSFGSYTMSIAQAWRSVFDPAVWTSPGFFLEIFLGEGLGGRVAGALGVSTDVDLSKETLIVWRIRMPRVVVAIVVGATL